VHGNVQEGQQRCWLELQDAPPVSAARVASASSVSSAVVSLPCLPCLSVLQVQWFAVPGALVFELLQLPCLDALVSGTCAGQPLCWAPKCWAPTHPPTLFVVLVHAGVCLPCLSGSPVWPQGAAEAVTRCGSPPFQSLP
jgi:hypothetical protein